MHMPHLHTGSAALVLSLVLLGFIATGAPSTLLFAATSDDVAARQAQLRLDLERLELEISAQQRILESKRLEKVSLERDVSILDAQIKQAELSIKARNIAIQNLASNIVSKQSKINGLNDKLEREKESLAQLLRTTNEIDSYSLAEVVLGEGNLSAFFEDLDSFDSIKVALSESFKEIGTTKVVTQVEKSSLEDRQAEEVELRTLQELQRRKIKEQEAEKQRILKATKGQEAAYVALIRSKEQTAAQIRAELFTLRGTAAIPFEKALEYANAASKKTGVRPAFILGVIAEESNLGENVGSGNWRIDMHPTRDQPIFAELMRHLGFNPDTMPVSKKPWYGYGGAMGPAQFIPSTWVLYAGYTCTKGVVTCTYNASKDRIGKATGSQPPNPWEPKDAIMASGILLMDNGADAGTPAAERLAALRYLAGWTNAKKAEYAFYGDDVMELAAKYQRQIDVLNGT